MDDYDFLKKQADAIVAKRVARIMEAADKYWEASSAARYRVRAELESVVRDAAFGVKDAAGVPASDMDYGGNMNIEVSDPDGVPVDDQCPDCDLGRFCTRAKCNTPAGAQGDGGTGGVDLPDGGQR